VNILYAKRFFILFLSENYDIPTKILVHIRKLLHKMNYTES
jgi:hypothetical protein